VRKEGHVEHGKGQEGEVEEEVVVEREGGRGR
jgi:hypothetical protein